MIYREYGKTGKMVSVLGFGGMRFLENEPLEKSAEIVIRAAELGINYFDTAPYYCHDHSEEIFGLALQQIRQPVFISTKTEAEKGKSVRRALERSLKRLKIDKINFYHLWCVKEMARLERAKKKGVIDAFMRAKAEGLIDHFVLSSHQPSEEIVEVVRMGLFEGITLGYNIINYPFRRDGVLAAAHAGMGVVTMNPLSGGVIPHNPERFAFLKERDGLSVTASALRFNMAQPEITVTLAGMASIAEVEENVAAVANLPELSAERLLELENHIEGALDHLCTGCSYCLPCPENIPIPKMMDTYNHYIFEGNSKAVTDRLSIHWGMDLSALENCSECRACEAACTQHLPILERFEELKMLVRKRK